MIDEARQDQATMYVLRMLPPAEALAFARELETDAELQKLVRELEDSASTVAMAAPLRKPPTSLRSRVLAAVRGDPVPASGTRGLIDWIPWTIAAALALTAGTFWYENRTFREGLQVAQQQLVELRQRKSPDRTSIVASESPGEALVVFKQDNQEGVVKLSQVTRAGEGKDYQLWIFDSSTGKPVSAGVLRPSEDGSVTFKPERPIPSADTFAISIEPTGGSAQPQGPIILQGKFQIGK